MGIFGSKRGSGSSKNIAKERLKLVLVHDRASISPQFLEAVKSDMISAISNYIEIDEDGMEIRITRVEKGNQIVSRLVADIPILGTKRVSTL